jgi:hypothetical protein
MTNLSKKPGGAVSLGLTFDPVFETNTDLFEWRTPIFHGLTHP